MDDKLNFQNELEMSTEQLIRLKNVRTEMELLFDKHGLNEEEVISVSMNFVEKSVHRVFKYTKTQREQFDTMRIMLSTYVDQMMIEMQREHPGLLDEPPLKPALDINSILKTLVDSIKENKNIPKNTHEFDMRCTLCENHTTLKPGDTFSVYNDKIKLVETEGCPSCYKGKGAIITHITYKDKDGNVLASMPKAEIDKYTISQMHEILRKL